MHTLLAQCDRFAISILRQDQEAYSGHFAGFAPKDFEPLFETRHNHTVIGNAIRLLCHPTLCCARGRRSYTLHGSGGVFREQ